MKFKRILRNQSGQGMTEYIIIVALVAIAAIAAFSYFGSTVRDQTASISEEMAGEDGAKAVSQAKTAADAAVKDGSETKGLKTYTEVANETNTGGQ